MDVRVKIDAVPEGLDLGDDARDKIFTRQDLEVDRQGVDGAAAEIPEKPAVVKEWKRRETINGSGTHERRRPRGGRRISRTTDGRPSRKRSSSPYSGWAVKKSAARREGQILFETPKSRGGRPNC